MAVAPIQELGGIAPFDPGTPSKGTLTVSRIRAALFRFRWMILGIMVLGIAAAWRPRR
jgi:hypothetical protein